jgi:hypothetical protein
LLNPASSNIKDFIWNVVEAEGFSPSAIDDVGYAIGSVAANLLTSQEEG